jgi:glycosyltransferase involved in cell wall biosynthesis
MPQPLIYHLIDEFRVGGAQTHLVTILADAQRRFPYRHRVGGLFEEGPIADDLRALGIEVDLFDLRADFQDRRFDRVVAKLNRRFRELRPDLVEAHLTWSRLLGLPAAAIARVPRRIGFEQGDIYMKSRGMRVANFFGQVAAQEVIVCSDALKQWVRETHRTSERRLEVFHNCVDVKRFVPREADATRAAFSLPDGAVRFVTVGTLGRGVNKRVDVSIRATAIAAAAGAHVGLVVVGDGEQRAELEQLAATLGISDRVHFLGMRSDVPAVIASCDVFVHAAPFEPFGIVCIEAMACGLPVIVPDKGGISEAVREGETGFIYATLDADALARAMIRLANDPAALTAVGAAALADVRARFTVEGYNDRLYALYGIES